MRGALGAGMQQRAGARRSGRAGASPGWRSQAGASLATTTNHRHHPAWPLLPRRPRCAAPRFSQAPGDEGAQQAPSDIAPSSSSLRLSFRLPFRAQFGENLALVGAGELLGDWDPRRAPAMAWTEGDVWEADVLVPLGGGSGGNGSGAVTPPTTPPTATTADLELEYKYVLLSRDREPLAWTPGPNLRLRLPLADGRSAASRPSAAAAAPAPATTGAAAAATTTTAGGAVVVHDAWDGSARDVQTQVARLVAAVTASAAASDAAAAAAAAAEDGPDRPPSPPSSSSSSSSSAAAAALAAAAAGSDERDDVKAAVDEALAHLDAALRASARAQADSRGDPASPAVLEADRAVAAATRRAIAMSRALESAVAEGSGAAALPAAGRSGGGGGGSEQQQQQEEQGRRQA